MSREENAPLVSVIVPVYKAENYLHKCVDSLLAQTFTDFEVILVNDGSPDGSGEICDEYAKKDSRIRVIHKENGGVSSARNMGLENSCGKWIAFVDSDDYLGGHFLDVFEKDIEQLNLIHFGFKIEKEIGSLHEVYKFENQIITIDEALNVKVFSSYSWSYFFRSSLLKKYGILFNVNIKYSEDREFILKYLFLTSCDILLIDNTEYIYTYNPHSAVNTKRTIERCTDDLIALEQIYQTVIKNKIDLNMKIHNFLCGLFLKSYVLVVATMCEEQNYRKYATKEVFLLADEFPIIKETKVFNLIRKFPRLIYPYYKYDQNLRSIILSILEKLKIK